MPGHSFGTEAAASLQMCAGRPFTVTGVVLVAGLFGFGPIDGVKLHIYSVSFFTFCCFDFSRGLYCFTASCQVCTFSCFQLCLQLYIVFSVPFSLGGQFFAAPFLASLFMSHSRLLHKFTFSRCCHFTASCGSASYYHAFPTWVASYRFRSRPCSS